MGGSDEEAELLALAFSQPDVSHLQQTQSPRTSAPAPSLQATQHAAPGSQSQAGSSMPGPQHASGKPADGGQRDEATQGNSGSGVAGITEDEELLALAFADVE